MTKQKEYVVTEGRIERIIGTIDGNSDGPQIVFFAGIHGNEPAGIVALKRVINRIKEAGIPFHGKLWALEGNLPALHANKRFIDKDLNRIWHTKLSDSAPLSRALVEVKERVELEKCVMEILSASKNKLYFFDLHTTSSHSVPFVSISDTLRNRKIVEGIPVPVILGLEEQMEGTLFNFFNEIGISMILYEAGQHDAASSIDNHEAFIWLILTKLEFINQNDLPDLQKYREMLAVGGLFEKQVYQMKYRHGLNGNNGFAMMPGFINFQTIRKNQILAHDQMGAIKSPINGKIFMPLYQEQGLEGFFIINEIRLVWLKVSEYLRKFGLDNYMHLLPGVKKHSEYRNCYVINPRIAMFFVIPVFHLLGYRKLIRHDENYIVKRRPFDWEQPPISVIKQRFEEIKL